MENEITLIKAIYDGIEIDIEKNSCPVLSDFGETIHLDTSHHYFDVSYVAKEDLNIAKCPPDYMNSKKNLVKIRMYAHNISESQINMELRKAFLKELSDRSTKINQLINNFEEVFNNRK